MTKRKEDSLAPLRHQKLYWLVEEQFAIGLGKDERIEIFEAIPAPRYDCGYRYRFIYTYRTLEALRENLPRDVRDTRAVTRTNKWNDLLSTPLSLKWDDCTRSGEIDRRMSSKPF